MTIGDKVFFRNVTCPWWICFTFDNPVRRMLHDPEKILHGLVKPGQAALDIGCGMGFFSIPLARMVGKEGKVTCVDLQDQMLAAARRRAEKAGLNNLVYHRCTTASLGLTEQADFALTFWMVHEVPDKQRLFGEIRAALRPGGRLLFVEPQVHVTRKAFESSVSVALATGFQIEARPDVPISMAALLKAQ